ncbi:MAG TPA: LCP family protein [Candidatus Limnocylindria bacterium]|nr:LCP family protein [Candidatus Limnocylindria bacterium]
MGSKNYHAITTTSYQPAKFTTPDVDEAPPGKKRKIWKRLLILLFLVPFIFLAVVAAWDFRNFSGASKKLFGTNNAWKVLLTDELQATADGRVNILLVGYSVDDPGHAGALLTDSVLILSLDKDSHTGYMLSVPRDLYVTIPDYGAAKVNEAYQAGETMKFRGTDYPRGGMGLLEKVISDNLDIELHYYALINYTAVKEVVDALDGVSVTIKSPDPRGIYDPNFPREQGGKLKLSNGTHTIDGQTALRLTRARGSTYGSYGFPLSDFNRTQNQQQVFGAIKNELDWKLILDPRTNGKIFDAAGNNVKTDIQIGEVLPLYRLFTSVPEDKLQPVTLRDINGKNLLASYTTPTGQSALIPAAGIQNFSQIQAAIKKLGR